MRQLSKRNLRAMVLPAAAAIALVETLVLAALERVPAATLVAGLFVVIVLFNYFPQLESFKAFSIEAKLRQSLSEADEIMTRMKELALITAKEHFTTAAFRGRFASTRNEDQAKAIEHFSSVLEGLGIPRIDIEAVARPVLNANLSDAAGKLAAVVKRRTVEYIEELRVRQAAIFNPDPIDMSSPRYEKWIELNDLIGRLHTVFNEDDFDFVGFVTNGNEEMFERRCQSFSHLDLPSQDRERIDRAAERLVAIGKRAVAEQKTTGELLNFLETEYPHDEYFEEVFGRPAVG